MPFQMKVQPIDAEACNNSSVDKNDVVSKPATRSRLKRLFDRPFTNVLRSSAADKVAGGVGGAVAEFEPSSVALDKMVRSFMEDNEKTPAMTSAARYGRKRCNCFNRSSDDCSDDELDFDFGTFDSKSSFSDSYDNLKSLIPCTSKEERDLLADTSKIVEKNKACKLKEDLVKIVIESLQTLDYDAALCKSKWAKSSSIAVGEYEYIDVIIDHERIIIDVDFRSEFEIARSTGSYKAILELLPTIFVGKSDRLSQIIAIVAESVKHSLRKKGMHVAPWRKSEYIRAKWLGNFKRICPPKDDVNEGNDCDGVVVVEEKEKEEVVAESLDDGCLNEGGELDFIFVGNNDVVCLSEEVSDEGEKLDFSAKVPWQPPPVKLNSKAIVTGLASLLKEKL